MQTHAGQILDAVVARDSERFHASLRVFLILSVITGTPPPGALTLPSPPAHASWSECIRRYT